jgi:phosphate acetyltransferase
MSATTHVTSLFDPLFAYCRNQPPRRAAVVFPCSAEALGGAMKAARHGLISPIVIGPGETIRALAEQHEIDLEGARFEEAKTPLEAALRAVALAREGRADLLMKGSLHTDELMKVIVSRDIGLRTNRRISHSFVMDIPTYPKLLHITDAAVNIAPDLKTKRDIAQNCIDLARALGVERPNVAVLSAVETVTPGIPSTADAAQLVAMSKSGEITGGEIEGPLAFDNAISAEAAKIKGLTSHIAGSPDILVVPGIEAGNILFKALQYLAGGRPAGVVLGARVPVVLTSRADDAATRLVSVVVACASAPGR